jgi:hypothetical protein
MFQGSASLSSDADDLLFRSFNSGGNTVLGLGYSTYDITIPNGNLLITNVAKTINISSLAASWPVVTNGSKNLVSSNTASSYAFGTTNPSLDTNADTGINLISSTANKAAQLNVGDSGLTATFSIFSGRSSDLNTSLVWTSGTNLKFATQTSGQVANSGYTQIANFDGSGNFTFGNPAGNPTTAARVNINSSTQTISRITFSGQEFLQAATTSNDGIALILGINRTNNKQLWIGDSTRLASSSSNPVIRFLILPNATSVVIDSQSTNGTQLPITFGSSGATTTISASTLNLSGSSVSVNNSNFSVSRSVAGDVISSVINTNAGSTSNAVFQSTTQGASGGDPKCIFTISGVQSWVCGIDNSVNDQFIIGSSTDPGSSDKLIITTGGDITNASGDQIINTAGKTLKVKQGSNACAGTGAVLVGGTVTVNTTAVATGDIILLNCTTSGGTQGIITTSIVNGTSFTLTSSQILDTSTYSWWILKAA